MMRRLRSAFEIDIGEQRAARLEPGQVKLMHGADHALFHQHDIAVPAMRRRGAAERHRRQAAFLLQRARLSRPLRSPKRVSTSCSAIMSGAISAMTSTMRLGIALPVAADALMRVVGRDDQLLFADARHGRGMMGRLLRFFQAVRINGVTIPNSLHDRTQPGAERFRALLSQAVLKIR